jgi:hypothetical protein
MWKLSLIPLRTLEIHFNNLIIKVNVFLELMEVNLNKMPKFLALVI